MRFAEEVLLKEQPGQPGRRERSNRRWVGSRGSRLSLDEESQQRGRDREPRAGDLGGGRKVAGVWDLEVEKQTAGTKEELTE